jgi:D-glycero-D-manno-heptose 1,7-bisphosphate phosphatase
MTTATIRQCALLVGGLGTRLGAITARTPKPILPCGDRPFLAWLMRELLRYGVSEFLLLTGHLSAALEASLRDIAAGLPRPATLAVSEEPVRAGTGGALFHARDRLDRRFLLCNGDSLFDFNFASLLAAAARDDASVIGRIALRRLADASRFGTVDLDGDRVTAFRERPPVSERGADQSGVAAGGLINAGMYLFERRLIDELSAECSLERDVLPRLASRSHLRGTLGKGYFRDIGIPEDLKRAQTEIPSRLRRPALFLDRDGTINVNHGWVGSRERFEWIPGALAAIRAATEAGWHVFVVTNQSGVARGFYDEAALRDLHDWMTDEIRRAGGTVDDIRYCPFHEDAALPAYRRASDWRKPGPGMVLDLIRAWELDPARCVLVGDQPSDLDAAEAAGIAGQLFPGGNLAEVVLPILARSDAECGIDAQG